MCVPKCDIFWSYKISYKFVTPKYYPIMCILYVTHLRLDFIKSWWYMTVGDMFLTPNRCLEVTKSCGKGFGTFWNDLENDNLCAKTRLWPRPLSFPGRSLGDRGQWPWPLMILTAASETDSLCGFSVFSKLNGSNIPNNSQISILIP